MRGASGRCTKGLGLDKSRGLKVPENTLPSGRGRPRPSPQPRARQEVWPRRGSQNHELPHGCILRTSCRYWRDRSSGAGTDFPDPRTRALNEQYKPVKELWCNLSIVYPYCQAILSLTLLKTSMLLRSAFSMSSWPHPGFSDSSVQNAWLSRSQAPQHRTGNAFS